ncbi:hypothetical protein [Candidatus Viridilinea mediisalina]|uniref:Uncharacterized protein n=1 Tax=Candidatus Viridilinea mediisalina TaxID=2024553 RepID=A0A2A6RFI4_9CHLR|nr:hypothetical protein [Candidatus Viridilinea mediisalina]PDW01646.1 hypothetical protein CJ255_18090 [Candidatus Viridilinea mediisalina]
MVESPLFIEVARQHGYSAEAAHAALEAVRAHLVAAGLVPTRLYIYRSSDGGLTGAGSLGAPPLSRPRVLLAFSSADAALAFAQRGGISRSPRLVALSLSQALATVLQRPSIAALYLAAEGDYLISPGTLPPGLRIERSDLFQLLDGGHL